MNYQELSPREKRSYHIGSEVTVRATTAFDLVNDLIDMYELSGSDIPGHLKGYLRKLITLGKRLQEKPAPIDWAVQHLLFEIQRTVRELDAAISLHYRHLYPGSEGKVPNPIEGNLVKEGEDGK